MFGRGGGALTQAAERSCGCSIPESVQDQVADWALRTWRCLCTWQGTGTG